MGVSGSAVSQRMPARLTRRGFASLSAAAALAACAALAGCGNAAGGKPSGTTIGQVPASAREHEQISNTIFVFDTVVTLTASCARETLDAACERCEYFESIFSRTIDSSDIGRINAAAGQPVEVAPETADIIAKALGYCEESGGLFDITIGAISTLWDFKKGRVPAAGDIAEALAHVGYGTVKVDGTTVALDDAGAKLDLGGIAKGYIADDIARLFLEAGCDSACINLGGNVKTVGVKPDGSDWHVGIQDPNEQTGAVIASVHSQDSSAVTSGLYERQFTKKGKKYWHILDPRTGWPVQTDLVSATIFSDASIDGDGYTKPLFMMGRDAALSWFGEHEGIEGLVVGQDGAIEQSSGNLATLM